jgi:hypothetical protein
LYSEVHFGFHKSSVIPTFHEVIIVVVIVVIVIVVIIVVIIIGKTALV